jgi:Tol biopolymer transport system component
VVNLTNNSVADFGISWSPDGTRIAFASTRDGNAEIYVMQADGTRPQRLTHRPESDIAPVWSPDGTRIAFEQRLSRAVSIIYVMAADGSNLTRLADGIRPVWSPNGTQLIFSDSIQSDAEIHLINADGSDERYLVNGNRPSWSPDGTRILFDYNAQVYTINVNGTDLTALADGIEPIWSPDGTQIALVSSTHTSRALAIMDADGTNLRDLAAGEASAPQWSADGRMIAFRRNAAIGIGGGVVMVVRVDDGTEHSLARYDLGRIFAFAWQP